MKILYIGQYRQGGYYGRQARDFAKTLLATGYDITLRPLYVNHSTDNNIDHSLLAAEYNGNRNFDVMIQHAAPHAYDYNKSFGKNIGIYPLETSNHSHISWPCRAKMMDEIWFIGPRTMNKMPFATDVQGVKTRVVSTGIDIAKYGEDIKPLNIDTEGKFVFYFSGLLHNKYQIERLLIAFHTRFDRTDNVMLLLHIYSLTEPSEVVAQKVQELTNRVKQGLNIHSSIDKYITENIITEPLPENYIAQLHKTGHCLIYTSMYRDFDPIIIDALGYGNTAILPRHIEQLWRPSEDTNKDDVFFDNHRAFTYSTTETPLYWHISEFNDLYTGRETGWELNISSLSKRLGTALLAQNNPSESIEHFSYEKKGQLLKELLETNE